MGPFAFSATSIDPPPRSAADVVAVTVTELRNFVTAVAPPPPPAGGWEATVAAPLDPRFAAGCEGYPRPAGGPLFRPFTLDAGRLDALSRPLPAPEGRTEWK